MVSDTRAGCVLPSGFGTERERTIETEIAAHRGGAALWPENSAAAFRGAVGLGVEQVEFDVQLSADGALVIFHDGTLERMTDGRGPVSERTLDELRALEIRDGGGRIQTLDEGLDILAPSPVVLRCELKTDHRLVPYAGLADLVVARLDARGLLPRTVFTSFHLPTLAGLAARALPVRGTAWLLTRQALLLLGADALVALARRTGVAGVGLSDALLDADTLVRFRAGGLAVAAFGGDGAGGEEAAERVLGKGVDVFTADRPDVALRVRKRLAGASRPARSPS